MRRAVAGKPINDREIAANVEATRPVRGDYVYLPTCPADPVTSGTSG